MLRASQWLLMMLHYDAFENSQYIKYRKEVVKASHAVIGIQEGKKKSITLLSEYAFLVPIALWYSTINSSEKNNHMTH